MPSRNTQYRRRQVRIIGGKWRGRKLQVASRGVRPTPDRARVTLFNWLYADLPGARVLDLFAGSGVLGFEALSRGAAHATLLEREYAALDLLIRHRELLGADNALIEHADAGRWLDAQDPRPHWDVVFLDPPFGTPTLSATIAAVARLLTANGVVYVEADAEFDLETASANAGLGITRRSRAGAVHYALLRP